MGKVAFIFPGQGAQYVGMGKDFYEQYQSAKTVYDLAEEASGVAVKELCFTENEKLNITEYTQIAMLATEIAILSVLEDKGIVPDVCAGLSLGEYGALAASHVMNWKDLFVLIRKRGIYMQQAYPEGGAMAAIIGMDSDVIGEVCDETAGIVSIANYNCPGQIVITGELEAVTKACDTLKEKGARRCLMLKVSGPFHSELLKGAGEQLGEALENVTVSAFAIPYVSNVTSEYITDRAKVKELLKEQVSHSVCWQQSMENMIADGVDTFVEIGPGKTLAGFARKINKEVTVLNVEKTEDLEQVLQILKGDR